MKNAEIGDKDTALPACRCSSLRICVLSPTNVRQENTDSVDDCFHSSLHTLRLTHQIVRIITRRINQTSDAGDEDGQVNSKDTNDLAHAQ